MYCGRWRLRQNLIAHAERSTRPMSALGQKQTFAAQQPMSALHPKADMCGAKRDVRLVPIADIDRSITPTVSDDLVNFNRRRTQPPGIPRQPCRHWACSKSQLRLAGSLLELVDTQLLPQSCMHWLKRFWQLSTTTLGDLILWNEREVTGKTYCN